MVLCVRVSPRASFLILILFLLKQKFNNYVLKLERT